MTKKNIDRMPEGDPIVSDIMPEGDEDFKDEPIYEDFYRLTITEGSKYSQFKQDTIIDFDHIGQVWFYIMASKLKERISDPDWHWYGIKLERKARTRSTFLLNR